MRIKRSSSAAELDAPDAKIPKVTLEVETDLDRADADADADADGGGDIAPRWGVSAARAVRSAGLAPETPHLGSFAARAGQGAEQVEQVEQVQTDLIAQDWDFGSDEHDAEEGEGGVKEEEVKEEEAAEKEEADKDETVEEVEVEEEEQEEQEEQEEEVNDELNDDKDEPKDEANEEVSGMDIDLPPPMPNPAVLSEDDDDEKPDLVAECDMGHDLDVPVPNPAVLSEDEDKPDLVAEADVLDAPSADTAPKVETEVDAKEEVEEREPSLDDLFADDKDAERPLPVDEDDHKDVIVISSDAPEHEVIVIPDSDEHGQVSPPKDGHASDAVEAAKSDPLDDDFGPFAPSDHDEGVAPSDQEATPVKKPAKRRSPRSPPAPPDSDSDFEIVDVEPPRRSARASTSKATPKSSKGKARASQGSAPGTTTCPAREDTLLEPLFLAPLEATVENSWVCLFFRFCVERHKMYEIRRDALAEDRTVSRDNLTKDECMKSLHIGNVYRQLDPSSRNMAERIIEVGDQGHVEVCFRVFLCCQFYNSDTWELLCSVATGGLPTWAHFEADMPAMEAALYQRSVVEGQKIYYGGFQLVPPTVYFTDDRNKSKSMANFASSLRLVLAAMRASLPDQLKACKYAVDASYVLQTIPTLGGFLSLNILTYLNDTTNFQWVYRNFATCGPGSRSLMQRMFGKQAINSVAMEEAGLKWLTEKQWTYYARLGLDPSHEWETGLRPGMRALDIENALCWCHRYINAFSTKDVRSLNDLPLPSYDPAVETNTGPPAWCVEERWRTSSSRTVWDGEHAEIDDRLSAVDDDEQVYEVEKVITRLGSGNPSQRKKNDKFRVRWLGWTPEEDTWETQQTLADGAADALADWTDWENRVWRAIDDIKRKMPYRRPQRVHVQTEDGEEEEEEEEEGDGDGDGERAGRATRSHAVKG